MAVSLVSVGVLWLGLILWVLAMAAVFNRPIPWLPGLFFAPLPVALFFGLYLSQVLVSGDASNRARGSIIRRRDRPVAYWAMVAFIVLIPFLVVAGIVVRR
jgi:hypothetical protein